MTPEQRQELMRLLEKGEDLSHEWARILFPPEKREYELVYHGKDREEDIIADTLAVPLQAVRTFGRNGVDWHNMLICGDNLQGMKTLLEMKKAGKLCNADGTPGIRLIYIDPPFATKEDFRGTQDQKAYQDKIAGAAFLEFLRKRLVLMREFLADDGSVYVHLDIRKLHYAKTLMDEVFGEASFTNEIIWKRTSAHSDSKTFANVHDTILFYTRSDEARFFPQYIPYTEEYIAERYKHVNGKGRRFADDNLIGTGLKGGGYVYEWKGVTKNWRCPIETMSKYEKEDRLYYTKQGVARVKRYLDELPGMPPLDLWADIYPVNSQAAERVDYPTQKPESLLERIIASSSAEGDIVLDAFAGSGTTLAVGEKLKRRWIGIDCGKLAIYTVQEIHEAVGSRIGSKVFIIAPALTFDFQQDYIDFKAGKEKVRYYALRIPYSLIHELHRKEFAALRQPSDEMAVNDTVEAVGFDFIRTPELKYKTGTEKPKGELFELGFIKIGRSRATPLSGNRSGRKATSKPFRW